MLKQHWHVYGVVTFMLVAMLLAVSCGGNDDDDSSKTEPTATSESLAEPTATESADEGAATEANDEEPTASTETGSSDQSEPVVLNFAAAATGGGSGQANAPVTAYCYVISGGAMREVSRMVDSRLIAWTPDMSDYVPEIAESWEFEGNTLTFHLRETAMWHDGEPVTAEDVLFTFNLVAHPDVGSRYAVTFASVEGYDELQSGAADTMSGITATNDHTVSITMTEPASGLLPGIPVFDILPEHLLGDVPPAQICENSFWVENRVGSGPFKWVQLVEGQRVELEAFDDYFLGRPGIDEINLLFFDSVETSLAAFEQGSSLVAPLTAANLEYAQGLESAQVESISTGVLLILPNTDHFPEFADPRVRQAMRYAIDAETIADTLFKGVAAEATSHNMPWLEWSDSPELIEYTFDPEMAEQLLDEADWDSSKEYTLWYYYPDSVSEEVVQAIQQYWQAVGINVKVRFDDGTGLRDAATSGELPLLYGAWAINPPSEMATLWSCDTSSFYGYPCIEEFDELLAQARATFDPEEQQRLYQEAIEIQNQQMASIFLWNRMDLLVASEKLNVGDNGAWGAARTHHNFAEDWTLED